MDDVHSVSKDFDHKWRHLRCEDCGHWRKGLISDADMQEWFQKHTEPGVFLQVGMWIQAESTCPNPCGGYA